RVLGSGHYPERVGERDVALLAELREAAGQPFVTTTRVRDESGVARDERMILGGCFITRDGAEVAVAAGRALSSYVADVETGAADPVRIALTGPDGALPPGIPGDGGKREIAVLANASGEPVARVIAALDDRDLDAQLDALRTRNLGVGAAAVVLAFSLAGLLAMRLTRPLTALERAAQRVGRGDLGSTIDGSHGGREVTRAFEAFNDMTRELDRARARLRRAERIAAWRDIARRIAHEIKNPLSPIQVSIETMRKTKAKNHPDFDEIFEESTLTILEEVERMKSIVSAFSDFARLPRPRPSDVSLLELSEHVARLHGGEHVKVVGEGTTIRADREQLTQVLVNLVQNGLSAGSERDEGKVVLTVR
ncbi:MAG: HAMP domain-containing protein, partial [Polyangiaceae bacterium]|nr:HAMP domain-containing protein [Polyangiaceae bacterium]